MNLRLIANFQKPHKNAQHLLGLKILGSIFILMFLIKLAQ